jgi:predicted amidohydrolase
VYIAAVNTAVYGGNSMIVSPKGEIMAETDDKSECIVHARIESAPQEEYRKKFPVLRDVL